jgi:dTDP-4-amino-4,6-dideoxygalactose transaminase
MSNICAGIGRGQMTVLDDHIAHHQKLNRLYKSLLSDVEGITVHDNPSKEYDSNFWLVTITLAPDLHVVGEDEVYREPVKACVGGVGCVMHPDAGVHTDCEPNRNVEALRIELDKNEIEVRPLWKPMHLQPVFAECPAYVNGVSESLFRTGLCLPSGPCVSEEDVRFIVSCIKQAIGVR